MQESFGTWTIEAVESELWYSVGGIAVDPPFCSTAVTARLLADRLRLMDRALLTVQLYETLIQSEDLVLLSVAAVFIHCHHSFRTF